MLVLTVSGFRGLGDYGESIQGLGFIGYLSGY